MSGEKKSSDALDDLAGGIIAGVIAAYAAGMLGFLTAAAIDLIGWGRYDDPRVALGCLGFWGLAACASLWLIWERNA